MIDLTSQKTPDSHKKKKGSYHHGNLREALIVAAIELIHDNRSTAFTLRQLARRLGVSHAAAYHHFTDKSALLAAVAEAGFERLHDAMLEGLEREGEEPLARLVDICLAYVRFASQNRALYRVMFSEDAGVCRGEEESEAPKISLPVELIAEALVACREADLLEDEGTEVAEIALHQWSWLHGLGHLNTTGHLDESRKLEPMILRALQLDFGALGNERFSEQDLEALVDGRSE